MKNRLRDDKVTIARALKIADIARRVAEVL